MNEQLKPVASYFESPGKAEGCAPSFRKIVFGVRGGNWKPLHYIPDTHRVVSVELLGEITDMLDASDLSDYGDELRAIIDNKEPT